MTRKKERQVALVLWTLYGGLSVGGLGLLAEALFVQRVPRALKLQAPRDPAPTEVKPGAARPLEALAEKRMTRVLARTAMPTAPSTPAPAAIESLLKLTGILDFGGKSPSVAVIETPQASKGYKVGDPVGETGAVVRTVADYVILEFEKKRYKLTFKGMEELPANAVGSRD